MAGTNRRSTGPAPRGGSRAAAPAKQGRRRLIDYPRRGYTGFRRWLPSWRFVVGSFLSFVFLCLGVGVAAYALTTVPDANEEVKSQTSTVYFSDGTVLGTFPGPRRTIVEYDTLPAYVGQAVVSAEDRTFFENQGISITGMARALINNLRGGETQGGSTLTQQYVERYYVGKTTTSYVGKAKEALLAIKIAQTETKEQILGRYLNTIYYGRDAYGIEAASRAYFDKPSAELTVSEAALLAGIIPSPNNWDPAVSPEKAQQRWGYVLDGMVRDGFLTQTDRDAQVFPTVVDYTRDDTYAGTNGYLLQLVKAELTSTAGLTDEQISGGGLAITTTIEPDVQQMAVDSVSALLGGGLSDGDQPDAALKVGVVSIDPATGGIVSLYGGPDFLVDQYNRVTQDAVQGGSTFKPFTLIAALEQGIPLTTTFSGATPQTFGDWTVNNFSDESFGRINLIKATEQSVNTVYAQLNLEVGPDKTAEAAARAGITTPVSATNASNVLGSDTVHPLDMASAYATIAAQGVYHQPFMVSQALYPDGTAAYVGQTPAEQRFDADVMADTTYAMTQVVQKGSAASYVKPLDRDIAGKTGTSSDNKSAWFVGFTPQIATAVALSQTGENGKDQVTITPWGTNASGRTVKQVTGGTWPSALWADYMAKVFTVEKYATNVEFPARANVGGAATPAATATSTPQPAETQAPAEPAQPTQVAVPSGLEGTLSGDAQAAVVNAGLVPSVVSASSSSVAAGAVISVSPGAGTMLDPGSTVTITVSTGPAVVPSPAPTRSAAP
ncbi:MAG TPA: transglycosylase domain-containing protein [Friedmanniella sp.]